MAEGENIKYKGINPSIAKELMVYESQYFREDKPVPFCGLYIYPCIVRDMETFYLCTECLTLNRKESKEGLRMNNLQFLLAQTQKPKEEGSFWSFKIQKLFELVFHIENGLKCLNPECGHVIKYDSVEFIQYIQKVQELQSKIEQGQQISEEETPRLVCPECGNSEFLEMIKIITDPETKKPYLLINGQKIVSKDFDRLKEIVLFQNMPDYRDDSWVDPELKKDYNTRMELLRRKNDAHATLEKKVVALSITTNLKIEEIFEMSIRKFTTALSLVDDLINYKIMKTAAMSGFVQMPEGKTIEHWLYKPEKDMYGDAYADLGEAKQKLQQVN